MPRVQDEVRALLFLEKEKAVSGEEMARRLSVSRAAVWKAMEALRAEGLPVEAVHGLGYRIAPGSDVMCEEALRAEMPAAAVRVLEETPSTNLAAKQWAMEGAPHGALVMAKRQETGRGRMGRRFESPEGGIYMSVVLRPSAQQAGLSLVTAAAAVAVCGAVQALCEQELSIKWVNDLYLGPKKCCGILTEGVAGLESGGFDYLVCGIGLNYTTPAEAFPAELRGIVTSLYPREAPPFPRVRLAAEIHRRLLESFAALPGTPFLPEYRRRSFVPGRRVTVMAGTPYEAEALSIDDEARLVVRKADGSLAALSAGEVSVKPQ